MILQLNVSFTLNTTVACSLSFLLRLSFRFLFLFFVLTPLFYYDNLIKIQLITYCTKQGQQMSVRRANKPRSIRRITSLARATSLVHPAALFITFTVRQRRVITARKTRRSSSSHRRELLRGAGPRSSFHRRELLHWTGPPSSSHRRELLHGAAPEAERAAAAVAGASCGRSTSSSSNKISNNESINTRHMYSSDCSSSSTTNIHKRTLTHT